jgi:predicted ATPase
MVQHCAASLHYRREMSAVQTQAEALLPLATAQGSPHRVGWGTFWQGWVLIMQGQGATGLAQMHQSMQAILATRQGLSYTYCRVVLAAAAGQVGEVEAGLRLLAGAITAFEAGEQGELLAEAYRLQGEFLLRQAASDAMPAEACFHPALEVAPLYGWFTEGFDTADLQEARALLDALGCGAEHGG